MKNLKLATRKSPLALWQARHVAQLLQNAHPNLRTTLLPISTKGDEILDKSLAKIGGKGLFIKELETAMINGHADIAVHSMKDVPVKMPEQMQLPCILERADPSDAFVSVKYASFDQLPVAAVVGTSSLRRQSQLLNLRPDLIVKPLRGNVGTRLEKLGNGEFDAIILASAGLQRLGKADLITHSFDWKVCLPAVGQGAIGIECLNTDHDTQELLVALNHLSTQQCVSAERAVNEKLGGSCTSPLAAYATAKDGIITLRARVAAPNGSEILETMASGDASDAQAIGRRAAITLENLGAKKHLNSI